MVDRALVGGGRGSRGFSQPVKAVTSKNGDSTRLVVGEWVGEEVAERVEAQSERMQGRRYGRRLPGQQAALSRAVCEEGGRWTDVSATEPAKRRLDDKARHLTVKGRVC